MIAAPDHGQPVLQVIRRKLLCREGLRKHRDGFVRPLFCQRHRGGFDGQPEPLTLVRLGACPDGKESELGVRPHAGHGGHLAPHRQSLFLQQPDYVGGDPAQPGFHRCAGRQKLPRGLRRIGLSVQPGPGLLVLLVLVAVREVGDQLGGGELLLLGFGELVQQSLRRPPAERGDLATADRAERREPLRGVRDPLFRPEDRRGHAGALGELRRLLDELIPERYASGRLLHGGEEYEDVYRGRIVPRASRFVAGNGEQAVQPCRQDFRVPGWPGRERGSRGHRAATGPEQACVQREVPRPVQRQDVGRRARVLRRGHPDHRGGDRDVRPAEHLLRG